VRKLLPLPLLVALSLLARSAELPRPIGTINDYGQTLDRTQREEAAARAEQLKALGLALVYLASWHDPYDDPDRYASAVFDAWELGSDALLIVFLRDARRVWEVRARMGPDVHGRVSREELKELLVDAARAANRTSPGRALMGLMEDLQARVAGVAPPSRRSISIWPFVLGAVGLLAAGIAWRAFLCPRCLRPLRRGRSLGRILWVCPRCRYTRAARWGSGPGSRRGFGP